MDDNLRNQFNFVERASQTLTLPRREKAVQTEPPPAANFGETATQWEIYDSYVQREAERTKLAQANKGSKKSRGKGDSGNKGTDEDFGSHKEEDILHSKPMLLSMKIIERMVNQNKYDEIAQDYKYWNDDSDMYSDEIGSLLPLWKWNTEHSKKKAVTAISWNKQYHDFFAVGYGSYNFTKQKSGLICCYSLKNPSMPVCQPEYTIHTKTGIMCLDFHPQHSYLLAVGDYSGCVKVYDLRNKVQKPIYCSTVKNGRHTEPVWQVRWAPDLENSGRNLHFYSISSDGRVTQWSLTKNDLEYKNISILNLVNKTSDKTDAASLNGFAGGICFDFNPKRDHIYLVGTEEGTIHQCSVDYSSQYLHTYFGHKMPVYAVKWNNWHKNIFVSGSADWTVKLWREGLSSPIMSFDLGSSVGDVGWAPFSSTVFAAVTSDGKVQVYDLSVNKNEPLCNQSIVKKAKLTHISFNSEDPIVNVGDDKGLIFTLKLSPNLRKVPDLTPPAEDEPAPTLEEAELEKLNKILGQMMGNQM